MNKPGYRGCEAKRPFFTKLVLGTISCIALNCPSSNAFGQSAGVDKNGPVLVRDTEPQNGNGDLFIPMDKRPALESAALAGSSEAAERLGDFYSINTAGSQEGIYWLTIAVENGSKSAIYKLGFALHLSSDLKDRKRALFWLRIAAKSNLEPDATGAKDDLRELGAEK
jgi:hypothetical protein